MNSLDCYVTRILGLPFEQYGKWWLKVEYDNNYGRFSTGTIMFNTNEEAKACAPGYHFMS